MRNKFIKDEKISLKLHKNRPAYIVPDEKPKSLFATCRNCPYAGHGFLCGSSEENCLRSFMNKPRHKHHPSAAPHADSQCSQPI